jgi:hypothetical protein
LADVVEKFRIHNKLRIEQLQSMLEPVMNATLTKEMVEQLFVAFNGDYTLALEAVKEQAEPQGKHF